MKKFLLMFAAVAAIAFVGCKTETKPAEETTPQEEQVTDEYTEEGVTADLLKAVETGQEAEVLSFLDGIKAKAEEFMNAGDNNKYFNIINILKNVWEANKDAILEKIPTLAEKITGYIDVPEALKPAFADFVANAAKEKVNDAVEAVTDAAAEKVDAAKEAVKDAASDAKEAAGDALQKAGEDLKK